MITQSSRSLLDISSQCKIIPIVENRVHFTHVLDISQIKAILLRHCNLYEFTSLLHVSPSLVIPYIVPSLTKLLPLPFIASGLISTPQQVQAVLRSGASAVAVSRPELWL